MVKALALALLVFALFGIGCYQVANMWIAQRAATTGSLFALLPNQESQTLQIQLDRYFPLRSERRFLAAVAVDEAEQHPDTTTLARATFAVSRLAQDQDEEALRARLALLRHDDATAFQAALAAREMDIVNNHIADLAQRRKLAQAIALQQQVIVSLQNQRTSRELEADAYWHLGILENQAATRSNPLQHLVYARNAFEQNVALTPLSGRALLSAGYAELALGNITRAEQCFTSAFNADPSSASAEVGLARIALAQHQRARAQELARKAYRMAPTQGDVVRLHNELNT